MGFVDGFYSFFVELNDTQRNLYQAVKLKVPKHPEESYEYLVARQLAYLHSFEDGLQFTQGLYETKEPTFQKTDVTQRVELWAEVGVPDKKKLAHALKQLAPAVFRVYFTSEEEIAKFCHHLRGSKSNWVSDVEFYLLDLKLIEQLADNLQTRSYWNITFCDDTIYLSTEDRELEAKVINLNIWDCYQNSLGQGGFNNY